MRITDQQSGLTLPYLYKWSHRWFFTGHPVLILNCMACLFYPFCCFSVILSSVSSDSDHECCSSIGKWMGQIPSFFGYHFVDSIRALHFFIPFQPLNSWFHATHRHGLWIRYVHMLAMNGPKLSIKIYMGASGLTSYMLVPGRLHVAHQMEVEADVISCNVASRPFVGAGGARWWALLCIVLIVLPIFGLAV